MRAHTGLVTPSPWGPHVEQVGWGVARQVVRVLRRHGVTDDWLEGVPDLAEDARHLVHVVFERRTATGVSVVRLEDDLAVLRHLALSGEAAPGSREALVVRALHDVAQHGVGWLDLPGQPADWAGLAWSET